MKYLLISLLLMPLAALAAKPDWLRNLEARQDQPVHVDRITVPQPPDSKLGYWTVTHERQPAETKEVPVRSIRPTDDTPETRIITTPARIIHYWAWVEQEAKFQGNAKSLVFHREGCRFWDCADCTRYFATFADAIDQGFRACGVCKPEEAAE